MEFDGPIIHWLEKLPDRAHCAKSMPNTSNTPRSTEVEAGPFEKLTAATTTFRSSTNVIIPRETDLAIRIVDHATKIVINFSFVNTSKSVIQDGYFTFPFPSGCSLTKFRCFIGAERVLTSKVKPLNKAIAEYQGAVSNSKSAALFAQRTAEIFTVCLGNIPPDTTLRAEVSLAMLLKDKLSSPERISTLTLPTYIAPRYGNPPSNLVNSTGKNTKHHLSLRLEVVSGAEIMDIKSSTHTISVQKGYGPRPCHTWDEFAKADSTRGSVHLATVKLSKPISTLDGDIVFDIVTRPQDQLDSPQAWIETHPSLTDHHAIMLNIPANALLKQRNNAIDSEILFLADRSGSMVDKIPALKSAMQFFLKGLPLMCRFNIWSFGSNFSSLWTKSKLYSRETMNEAERHVENDFHASLGGTELLPALKEIFKSRSTTSIATTDIIILTDGEVWREEETIEFINSARKHSSYSARFFCLGIGPAVSHSLVEGIAKAGGGYAEVLPASKKSGWEGRVVRMLEAALHNHIGSIELEVGEGTAMGFRQWKTSSFLQTPAATLSFSPFVTNRVFLLFEDTGVPIHRAVIALKKIGPNGKESAQFLKPAASDEPDLLLHTLAARGLLQDLETGQSRKHQEHASDHAIRREEERISCKYSLLSKWTCFIAVDEDRRSDNTLSDMIQDSIAAICKLEPSEWDPDLQRDIGWIPNSQFFLDSVNTDRSGESESGSDNESDDSTNEHPSPPSPPPPPPPPPSGNGNGSENGSGSDPGLDFNTGPSPDPSSSNGSDQNTGGSGPGASAGAGDSDAGCMDSRASSSGSLDPNDSEAGPSGVGLLQTKTNSGQAIDSIDYPSPLSGQSKPGVSHEIGFRNERKDSPFHKTRKPNKLRNILFNAIRTPSVKPSDASLETPSYWADEEENASLKSTELPCIVVPAQEPTLDTGTKYTHSSTPALHNPAQANHQQRNSPDPLLCSEPLDQGTATYYQPVARIDQTNHAIDGAEVIRSLIRLQDFDGRFSASPIHSRSISSQGPYPPPQPSLYQLFGTSFKTLLSYNETQLESPPFSQSAPCGESEIISSTVGVLAILRSHLSRYKDMWIRLEARAKGYLRTRIGDLGVVEELILKAFKIAESTNFEFAGSAISSPGYPSYGYPSYGYPSYTSHPESAVTPAAYTEYGESRIGKRRYDEFHATANSYSGRPTPPTYPVPHTNQSYENEGYIYGSSQLSGPLELTTPRHIT